MPLASLIRDHLLSGVDRGKRTSIGLAWHALLRGMRGWKLAAETKYDPTLRRFVVHRLHSAFSSLGAGRSEHQTM